MAADVGELKVKLSLTSADFERSVASMNRTLKAMGQEIRGLQNRGKTWGSSIDGLRQKQDAFSRLLDGQKTKVKKLSEEYKKTKEEQGEHAVATQKLAEQLNRATSEMNRTERELSEVTEELKRQESELARSQSAWGKLGDSAKKAGEKLKSIGDSMTSVGKTLSMSVTAPITALAVGATKAAIDFESAFAGVRKTVDTSEEGFAKLEKGILEMARTLPASASDIASVAESAGQLGIAENNILTFTRTIIDLGEATNLSLEQASSEFARFANITGMSQQDFDRLGSSVVALGNSMATTESEIVAMGMRLAAQGKQVGMSEAQIMALSGTMSSLGIQAEAGGTAMTKILKKMQSAVGTGGKSLKAFADVAGVSSKEFKKAFEEDAANALDLLVKGLDKSGKEGKNLSDILTDLGFKGVYESDTLLRMAGASDLLSEAVKTSSSAWEENSALSDEAAQRYETTASQLAMLKNKVVEIGISFGQVLIPMLMSVVDKITPVVERFAELDEKTKIVIIAVAGIAAAIGPLLIFFGTLLSSLGTIVSTFGVLFTAISKVGGILKVLQLGFAALTSPISLTIAAIVGVGLALVTAYKHFEGFRNVINNVFNQVLETIKSVMSTIQMFIMNIWSQITAFWNENGAQIQQATQNVWSVIQGIISAVMPVISTIIQATMLVIQMIIEQVWSAVKGVIQGVLDVILGLIKTFSSLFTGDWKGLWDGIKQLVSGAVTAIWNVLQLMFFCRIIKGATTFALGFRSIFTNIWNAVKSIFTSGVNSAKNIFTSGFNIIRNFANTSMSGVRNTISAIWNTIRTIFTTTINAIKNVVSNGFNNVLNTIKNIMKNVVSTVTGTATKMFNAGKDLVQGLINGIKEMGAAAINAITGVVDGVINKAKSLLGINSPSRVFRQIGAWTTEGWAIGVESKGNEVVNAVSDIALQAQDIAEHYASEELKLKGKLKSETAVIEKKAAADIAQIRKRSVEDIAKIERTAQVKKRKLTTDEVIKIRRIREDAAAKILRLEKSTADKVIKIRRIREDAAAKILRLEKSTADKTKVLKSKTTKEIIELEDKMNKDLLEETKRYIDDKKSLDDLTLLQEAQLWEQVIKLFAEGSKERVKVQQEYKKATDAINKEITSINKSYQQEMQKINDELLKNEAELTKAYTDELSKREDKYKSFANTFDDYSVKFDVSGQKLIDSMQNQVVAIHQYDDLFEQLSKRNISSDLLEEIANMGIKALPEMMALINMTDTQLTLYSALYDEKSRKAREMAEKELVGMKQDTEKQIEAMRQSANSELSKLQTEWDTKIKGLTKNTKSELSSLNQIGRDAGQGLLNGLASMQGPLINKATEIANAIKTTIQSALDIHSPSRIMRGFGVNIGEGLVLGMDDMLERVKGAADRLAVSVDSNFTTPGQSPNYDYSRTFAPTVKVYTQNSGADAMDRTLRRLAFQF